MSRRLLRSPRELRDRALQFGAILRERSGGVPTGELLADDHLAPQLPFPLPAQDAVSQAYPDGSAARDELLRRCDDLLAGRFALLGYPALDFGSPVRWHLDPLRGRTAPAAHWSRVPYLDPEVVGDHKVVWELNRHQHLVTLAQGHRLNPAPALLERIAALVENWLGANPPAIGINWASSLEVSLRAIAWTWVLHLTGTALPLPLRRRMVASLDLHGRHIERHLSTWFSPNTHLTGEALGLLYLGTAWPRLSHATRWRERGWGILCEQLPLQIRPDGTYFEQSSWYLGYTVDFYAHALRLALGGGLRVPACVKERVSAAARALQAISRRDGTIPLLGDDDGGRLLPLGPRPPTCFRDTLVHASVVLDMPDLRMGLDVPAHALWLLGTLPSDAAGDTPAARHPLALPEGGWYLLGGMAGESCLRAVIDAGPHGALSGAHGHADALAIDLTVDDAPVVSDPGACCYIGPERDRFRGTAVHSTLTLGGGNSAEPAGPFRWARTPNTTVHAWHTAPGHAWLDASHDGWSAMAPDLRHRRGVLWLEGVGLMVMDRLEGGFLPTGTGPDIRWHLAPGLAARLLEASAAVVDTAGRARLSIHAPGARLEVADAQSSSCYGDVQASSILIAHPGPHIIGGTALTLLRPGVHGEGSVEVTGASTWRLATLGGEGVLRWDGSSLSWQPAPRGGKGAPAALSLATPGGR